MDAMTQKTLELVEKIKSQQVAEKAFTTSLGLNWYDLEPAAKLLYPVITPLRNMIARVSGDGGNATNWKAITGINTANVSAGVSEGNRGGVITTAEQDFTAPYRGIGLEDYETFEAEYGSKNFDDLRALMVNGLLNSLMIQEEQLIPFGNGSDGIALGTPATPQLSKVAGSGSLGTITVSVKVVALTQDGYVRSTVAGGVATQVARTNADGTSDTINAGSSNKSAAATIGPLTAGDVVTGTVTAIKGAVAYAWYWGVAGSELLGAITTVNKVTFSAAAAGTQNASAITADNSKNSLVFTGFLNQSLGSTGYWNTLDGGTLTADGAGGVAEIETALKAFWDNNRVSPDLILVNSQELLNISKKVIAGGGTPLFRFVMDSNSQQGVGSLTFTAGSVVGSYLNKYTMAGGQLIRVMLHPNVPPGMILFFTQNTPYQNSRLRNTIQMKTRKEYYQIEWPLKSRKYEAGVYADELLQVYAPFMFGAIGNIQNG